DLCESAIIHRLIGRNGVGSDERECALIYCARLNLLDAAESEFPAAEKTRIASRLAESVDSIVPSAATECEARCFRVAAPLGNIASHVVRTPGADSEGHAVDRQRSPAKEIRAFSGIDPFADDSPRECHSDHKLGRI